jgi:hypothetical protein
LALEVASACTDGARAKVVLKADLAERQWRVFSFHDMEWAIDGQEMAIIEAKSYTSTFRRL